MKHSISIVLILTLLGCVGMDTHNISQDITYTPEVALPVGTMRLEYDSEFDLPLVIPPDNIPFSFTKRDTLYFNMNGLFEEREHIQSLFFRLDNINRFPAKVIAKVYFIDDSGDNVYLTPEEGITMPPAELNIYGQVIEYYKEWTDLPPLTENEIDILMASNRFVIELTITDLILTPEIRENFMFYYIQSAAGVEANLKIKLS